MILLIASWGIMAMCWSMVIYTQIAIFINTYYTGLFHFRYQGTADRFFYLIFCCTLANIPTYMLTYTSLLFTPRFCGHLMRFIYLYITVKIKRDDMYLLIEHMLYLSYL